MQTADRTLEHDGGASSRAEQAEIAKEDNSTETQHDPSEHKRADCRLSVRSHYVQTFPTVLTARCWRRMNA